MMPRGGVSLRANGREELRPVGKTVCRSGHLRSDATITGFLRKTYVDRRSRVEERVPMDGL